jgi:hypothetical protein
VKDGVHAYGMQLCRRKDKSKEWQKSYRKKMSVNISWKLREGKNKLEEDNKKGLWYESGMVGPHEREIGQNKEGIANKVVIPHCSHRQSNTHQHKISKFCANNPKNIAIREAQVLRRQGDAGRRVWHQIQCVSSKWNVSACFLPSTNIPLHSTAEGILPDKNAGHSSDSSDPTDDERIDNPFSLKTQEIERLEQWDFNDEEGINTDSHENN